jgi:hypothetical protein
MIHPASNPSFPRAPVKTPQQSGATRDLDEAVQPEADQRDATRDQTGYQRHDPFQTVPGDGEVFELSTSGDKSFASTESSLRHRCVSYFHNPAKRRAPAARHGSTRTSPMLVFRLADVLRRQEGRLVYILPEHQPFLTGFIRIKNRQEIGNLAEGSDSKQK